MKTVCLSVGHSVKDKGYYSNNKLLNEYELCLKFAESIKKKLDINGVRCFIVNSLKDGGSTGITGKIKAIQKYYFDLLIELHLNSFYKSSNNSEIFFKSNSNKSIEIADILIKKFSEELKINLIKKEMSNNSIEGQVLSNIEKPVILLKLFCIDNDAQLSYFINNYNLFVNLIYKSLL